MDNTAKYIGELTDIRNKYGWDSKESEEYLQSKINEPEYKELKELSDTSIRLHEILRIK